MCEIKILKKGLKMKKYTKREEKKLKCYNYDIINNYNLNN